MDESSSSSDYEMAVLLQLEYDTEMSFEADEHSHDMSSLDEFEDSLPDHGFILPNTPSPKKQREKSIPKPTTAKLSIVDPSWELLDPSPDIHALFIQYNSAFFSGKLSSAEVRWSPRMTLCAGLCVYERRGGFCSIRLSAPLLKLRPRKDLVETLLHEMIHAFLFLTHNNKDHNDHGPEFQKHMKRINESEGTDISIYHSFHDEVDSYRQHWWRCDGPCRNRKPYYGWVKRSMNRAPSSRDSWWHDHVTSCGGTYTKVKEPEGYKQKGRKNGKAEVVDKGKSTQGGDIRDLFNKNAENVSKTNDEHSVDPREKQSAKILDHIGKGLGSKEKIKSVSKFLDLTEESDVGEGYGREGNIHSVGRFLNGESMKVTSNSSKTFSGSGNRLGGSGSGATAGCRQSRLLNLSQNATNERISGQKRSSSEEDENNKRIKPTGIRNSKSNGSKSSDIRDYFSSPGSRVENSGDSELVSCPVCTNLVQFTQINDHLNRCLT